ncbi:MAG: hypothetical protein ACRDWA_07895 [Acidimicrobiia bacterium]
MPPFGFRLRALVLRDRLPATGTNGAIEVPCSTRHTALVIEKGTGRRPDHLILRQAGFASEQDARKAGKAAKAALRATGVATDVSMDLGPDLASTGIGQIVKDKIRDEFAVELRGDVQGVDILDEEGPEVRYMRIEAEGSVIANLDSFVETLGRFLESTSKTESDDLVQFASEVYMAAAFESSDRARFVTYITVLEILAVRERRTQPELDVIQTAVDQLDSSEDLDPSAKQSLRSGLLDLQSESVGASIRSLAESMDTSKLDLGDRPIRRFINDCYAARSNLVHDGHPGTGFDLRADTPRLARVAREALLSRLVSD